jgi:hypothetical protein
MLARIMYQPTLSIKRKLVAAFCLALIVAAAVFFVTRPSTGPVPTRAELRQVSGTFKMNTLNTTLTENGQLAVLEIYVEGDPIAYTMRGLNADLEPVIETIMTNTPRRVELLVRDAAFGSEIWQVAMDGKMRLSYEQIAANKPRENLTAKFIAVTVGVAAAVVLVGILYGRRKIPVSSS